MGLAATWKRIQARTGELFTSDGSRFNEADHLARIDRSMSSFDELGTYSSKSLIDLKSVYPLSRKRDKVEGLNGGDVTQSGAYFQVKTTSDPNSEVVFSSLERGRYIAGFDAVPGLGVELPQRPTGNQVVEWGYTDFVDGFVVGEDSDGMFFRVYSEGSLVEEERRENWYNPLDSGTFILDPAELNIYRFPFRWYKRGPVILSLAGEDSRGFGTTYRAHVTRPDGFISEPNQPLSMRVKNNGTGQAYEALVSGRQFFISGDYNPLRRITSESRLSQSVGTSFVPLVSAKQKLGDYETISTKLAGISVLSDTDLIIQIRILSDIGASLSFNDPSFSDNGIESAMQFNITSTTITDGIKVYETLVPGGQGNTSAVSQVDLPNLELPADGEVISLCARSVSGTATVTSVLRFREEW